MIKTPKIILKSLAILEAENTQVGSYSNTIYLGLNGPQCDLNLDVEPDYYSQVLDGSEEPFLPVLQLIDLVLDYSELVRQEDYLVVVDNYNLRMAWSYALGIMCYYSRDVKASLITIVRDYPTVEPSVTWPLSLFDLNLELGGALITTTEDYGVTKTIVTPQGEVIKGLF